MLNIKRKWRYLLEGKNKDGTVVVPRCVVSPEKRPDVPYMTIAGEIVAQPGEVAIFSTPLTEFHDFSTCVTASLSMVDGCGSLIEEWMLDDVTIKPAEPLEEAGHWIVAYGSSKWINHTSKLTNMGLGLIGDWMPPKKITIDGHGGHLCEAYYNGAHEVGSTIEEAIGRLIHFHPKECGFEIDILPCSTTAYERSNVLNPNDFIIKEHKTDEGDIVYFVDTKDEAL